MKKTLLLSLMFAGVTVSSFGQGLNGGFETWGASFGQPIEPTGWVTANLFAAPILTFPAPNPNPTSAFQATGADLYMGTYSLRLTSVVLQYNPDTANIPDTLGACVTGSVTMTPSFSLKDRIPFTGRPAIFACAAKYAPSVPTDTASIYVELSRWNGSSRDVIMSFWAPLAAGNSYINYSFPLTSSYLMPNFPDSLTVAITSTSLFVPRVGSTLHIDNISYSGWVGVDEYAQDQVIKVYPNPATESLTLDATGLKADLSHAEILDASGKLVGTVDMRSSASVTLNASMLPAGHYTYQLVGIQGIRLADGKFTIAR